MIWIDLDCGKAGRAIRHGLLVPFRQRAPLFLCGLLSSVAHFRFAMQQECSRFTSFRHVRSQPNPRLHHRPYLEPAPGLEAVRQVGISTQGLATDRHLAGEPLDRAVGSDRMYALPSTVAS